MFLVVLSFDFDTILCGGHQCALDVGDIESTSGICILSLACTGDQAQAANDQPKSANTLFARRFHVLCLIGCLGTGYLGVWLLQVCIVQSGIVFESQANSIMTAVKRVTTTTLLEMKRSGTPISMLTAYDFTFAALLDQAGVDVLLVGDSLGMVVQGEETTLPVTLHYRY